jgi:hypothetical protein
MNSRAPIFLSNCRIMNELRTVEWCLYWVALTRHPFSIAVHATRKMGSIILENSPSGISVGCFISRNRHGWHMTRGRNRNRTDSMTIGHEQHQHLNPQVPRCPCSISRMGHGRTRVRRTDTNQPKRKHHGYQTNHLGFSSMEVYHAGIAWLYIRRSTPDYAIGRIDTDSDPAPDKSGTTVDTRMKDRIFVLSGIVILWPRSNFLGIKPAWVSHTV